MTMIMFDDLISLTDKLKNMARQHNVPVHEFGRLLVRIMDPQSDGMLRATIIDIQEDNDISKDGILYAGEKSKRKH